MSDEQQLVNVDDIKAVDVYVTENGVEGILNKVRHIVNGQKFNAESDAGRKEISSFAYRIARTKTALDNMGKDLTEDARKQIAEVNKRRKIICDTMDELKTTVREPLTQWEAKEQARKSAHEEALDCVKRMAYFKVPPTVEQVQNEIDRMVEFARREWEEYYGQAAAAMSATNQTLEQLLAAAKQRKEEAAELERLRKEKQEADAQAAAERAELEQLRREKRERELAEAKAVKHEPEQASFPLPKQEPQPQQSAQRVASKPFGGIQSKPQPQNSNARTETHALLCEVAARANEISGFLSNQNITSVQKEETVVQIDLLFDLMCQVKATAQNM